MKMTVIPIIIRPLAIILKNMEKKLQEMEIDGKIKNIKNTTLLILSSILRVPEIWSDLLLLGLQ